MWLAWPFPELEAAAATASGEAKPASDAEEGDVEAEAQLETPAAEPHTIGDDADLEQQEVGGAAEANDTDPDDIDEEPSDDEPFDEVEPAEQITSPEPAKTLEDLEADKAALEADKATADAAFNVAAATAATASDESHALDEQREKATADRAAAKTGLDNATKTVADVHHQLVTAVPAEALALMHTQREVKAALQAAKAKDLLTRSGGATGLDGAPCVSSASR